LVISKKMDSSDKIEKIVMASISIQL